MGHQMKQFNVTQQVFDDLLVEQVSMPIDVPIEIHQTINGKPAVTRIETTNVLTVPRFSTHGDGWIYVPEELIDDVSASITGGGLVWLDDGGAIKCSGAQPSGAHTFDKKTGKWVLDANKQAEMDKQALDAADAQLTCLMSQMCAWLTIESYKSKAEQRGENILSPLKIDEMLQGLPPSVESDLMRNAWSRATSIEFASATTQSFAQILGMSKDQLRVAMNEARGL